jgi:uncharacterized protein YbcI
MNESKSTMAQQKAQAAIAFEQRRTGNHGPKSVTVVLSEGTPVITPHEGLSPAEKALEKTPAGAAQIREFHRQLFANSSDSLRQEIKTITGMEVREGTAEVEPVAGAVVQAFTTGNVVQVFQLVGSVPTETWSGNGPRRSVISAEVLQVGVARKSQESCSAGARPAWDEYGQFLSVTRSKANEHRR